MKSYNSIDDFNIKYLRWTKNIFEKGYKSVLSLEDLYDLIEYDVSASLGDELEKLVLNIFKDVIINDKLVNVILILYPNETGVCFYLIEIRPVSYVIILYVTVILF